MSIQAVLFDFDGTLADTLPLSFSAFQAVFQQYDHREVTNEELVAADILAGTAAGVRTYGVRWLSTYQSLVYEVEPDGIFERVAEFRGLLAKS